jgi:hypothetical protein
MSQRVGVGVEQAEQIKWWDALDAITRFEWNGGGPERGVELARECQHPDAQWLAALFPPGEVVTQERMREVMLEQDDDPRALYLASRLGVLDEGMLRAAEMGYAPAQVVLSRRSALATTGEGERWLAKAVALGDRNAFYELALVLEYGVSDKAKAIELYRKAAELNHREAQWEYGQLAFGPTDWERYHWCSMAAEALVNEAWLCCDVADKLPSFERGECGRILSTAAPTVRKSLNKWKADNSFLYAIDKRGVAIAHLERVIELHTAMLGRARRAIDCWSMAGRRGRVVKDMRVVIAKMAWAEVWRWGEPEHVRDARGARLG